jgi:hypothetical protein
MHLLWLAQLILGIHLLFWEKEKYELQYALFTPGDCPSFGGTWRHGGAM